VLTTGTASLTVTVRPASGNAVPSGSVTFTAGSVKLGSASLNGNGTATLAVKGKSLAVGTDTVTASYAGSAAFLPSSGTVSVTVSSPPAPVVSVGKVAAH
jgi:hypothetical protein